MNWMRLALLVLWAGAGADGTARAALILSVDVGATALGPNAAGQTLDLFIDNTGDTALQAQGLTFRIQLDDGLGGGNAPVITLVDLVSGTPWAGHVGSVINQTTQPEFWDVRVLSDIFGGQYAQLDPGSHTKLATVTFDTTGFTSGTWDLRLADFTLNPDPGDTKYNLFGSGNEVFPTINNGMLSVVPEPVNVALGFFGGACAGIGAWRWYRRRQRHSRITFQAGLMRKRWQRQRLLAQRISRFVRMLNTRTK